MKTKLFCFLAFLGLGFFISGCEKSKPEWEFMPDMYESTSMKAQKEDPFSKDGVAARTPPEGTVPRGFAPYHYGPGDTDRAGRELRNPLLRTKANMDRGQKIFNTYCIVCHGVKGTGEGTVVPPFPHPPSLLSDKVMKWPDGSIFNVISNGQNLMPSYRSQVKAEDRWAAIIYIRALQRASHPTPEDLKELKSLEAAK